MFSISCMAVVVYLVDPRPRTMLGRSTSGFQHRQGRHCLHQARVAVRCRASRMKRELHPTKNRPRGGFACIYIWMTAAMAWSFGHFQRQRWVQGVTAWWVPQHEHTTYVVRSSSLCGVEVLPVQKLPYSTASRGDHKQNTEKVPWLPRSRGGRRFFYRRRKRMAAQPTYQAYSFKGGCTIVRSSVKAGTEYLNIMLSLAWAYTFAA